VRNIIRRGPQGFVFRSADPKWIRWAFCPVNGPTRWFANRADAIAAFDAAGGAS